MTRSEPLPPRIAWPGPSLWTRQVFTLAGRPLGPSGPFGHGWKTGAMDLDPAVAARLKRNDAGLVAAVAQQHDTGEVLMLGWMDDEALARTMASGRATYWSRSRGEYWTKGETSGHRQWVRRVSLDCDGDTVLLQVDQEGSACHTGTRTCFDDGLVWETDPTGPARA